MLGLADGSSLRAQIVNTMRDMPSGMPLRRYLQEEARYLSPFLYLPLCWSLYMFGLLVLADTPPPIPAIFLIFSLAALAAGFLSLLFIPVMYEAGCTWKGPVSASFYALGNSLLVGVLFAVVGKATGTGLLPGEVYTLILIVTAGVAHAGYGLHGSIQGAVLSLISYAVTTLMTSILLFSLYTSLMVTAGAYVQFLAEQSFSALALLSTLLIVGGPIVVLGAYGVRWIRSARP